MPHIFVMYFSNIGQYCTERNFCGFVTVFLPFCDGKNSSYCKCGFFYCQLCGYRLFHWESQWACLRNPLELFKHDLEVKDFQSSLISTSFKSFYLLSTSILIKKFYTLESFLFYQFI